MPSAERDRIRLRSCHSIVVIWTRFLLVMLTVAVLTAACGGADRPTLSEPVAVAAAEDDVEPIADLTGTATDLTDGLTRSVTDLTDDPVAIAPGAPLLAGSDEFRVEIIGERGHDSTAFTQGLEFDGEVLFETRGQYGESAITEIDPRNGEVLRSVELDEQYFGEGVALVDDRLIMLTWREETALVFDTANFELLDEYPYDGEGWGLCYDGISLWMSDGSSEITRRDPLTFERLAQVRVTLDGEPVARLNELECINGLVWANVWTTDTVVVFDPTTGVVEARIDARPLRDALRNGGAADVLNGIAYNELTGSLVMTGKYWPAMFDVALEPCTDCVPDPVDRS